MPCLFLRNVPSGLVFDRGAVEILCVRIAVAAKCPVSEVEIHLENTKYDLFRSDGSRVRAPDVHVFVEWFERPLQVKVEIAEAIHEFLKAHDLAASDITFRDSKLGAFFLNGKLVEVKENFCGKEKGLLKVDLKFDPIFPTTNASVAEKLSRWIAELPKDPGILVNWGYSSSGSDVRYSFTFSTLTPEYFGRLLGLLEKFEKDREVLVREVILDNEIISLVRVEGLLKGHLKR